MRQVDNDIFAITFDYGRNLLDQSKLVQDFGLITALNTLDEKSLRSVDLHTIEDQPIQKRSQTTRDSEISVFGVDIFRDVLRAVTGETKPGIEFKKITGGDTTFSFTIDEANLDLPKLCQQIKFFYKKKDYQKSFSWIDNIRKIKDKKSIDKLNNNLVKAIEKNDNKVIITLPEIISWDKISGFSFTRKKRDISSNFELINYLSTIPSDATLSIELLKNDRIFIYDTNDNITEYSIYNCIYFEIIGSKKNKIIFNGTWYEIDNKFINNIGQILSKIPLSTLSFPPVEVTKELKTEEKGKRSKSKFYFKFESEENYNCRVSKENHYFLLDQRLIKTNRTTTAIELCDLLTINKQFIHVKHRKGGSAGLNHLFAQGNVAAEIMLGDKEFRKKARSILRKISANAVEIIPLESIKSTDYEIIFLILGDKSDDVKVNLPFFSKVNLVKTYENLAQRGFKVLIAGVGVIQKE